MANVGWWKHLGSFAFSIPRVKGDLEIWLKAFFITLVPTSLPDGLLRLLTRKRFTKWSSWSLSVVGIFLVIGRDIRVEGGLFSLCSTESLFYIINFSLHGFFINLLRYCVTSSLITTSTCVVRLQVTFLLVVHVISMLEVVKLALLMNISWFCIVRTSLMWSWSRHNRYIPLKH